MDKGWIPTLDAIAARRTLRVETSIVDAGPLGMAPQSDRFVQPVPPWGDFPPGRARGPAEFRETAAPGGAC